MTQAIIDPPETVRLWDTIPRMGETALTLVLLFLFAEALLGPLLASEQQPDGNPILRIMWLPVYAIVLGLAVLRAKTLTLMSLHMPLLVLLLGLTAASVLWSIDGAVTFRRAIAVIMTTGLGLHLANRYNWREMLTMFGLIWLFLAGLAYVISLGMPAIGLEQDGDHVGAWRGLWFQKNALGGHMSRATFLFAFLIITGRSLRRLWIWGLVLTIGLVFLTTSKTSLLGMLLGFSILGVGVLMKRGMRLALIILWFAVVFIGLFSAIIVFQPELLVSVLGRDLTLTGRTDIWEALRFVIIDRPWLGYGYGAFWAIGSEPADFVKDIVQWDVPTAHNGWIETWLSVGLVGMGLFALSYLATLGRAFVASFRGWNGVFALGFMAQFFLFNLSESMILQQNSIVWLTYVAISAKLVSQSVRSKPLRPDGRSSRQRDLLPIANVRRRGLSGTGQRL